jgi:hypothetical protein
LVLTLNRKAGDLNNIPANLDAWVIAPLADFAERMHVSENRNSQTLTLAEFEREKFRLRKSVGGTPQMFARAVGGRPKRQLQVFCSTRRKGEALTGSQRCTS